LPGAIIGHGVLISGMPIANKQLWMIERGTLKANAIVGQRLHECDQRRFLFFVEV
jgi:hypothetical protein